MLACRQWKLRQASFSCERFGWLLPSTLRLGRRSFRAAAVDRLILIALAKHVLRADGSVAEVPGV